MNAKTLGQAALLALTIHLLGCTKESAPVAPAPVENDTSQSNLVAATEAARKVPNFENNLQLGLAQLAARRPEEAVKSFEGALRFNPKSAIAFNDLCAAANEMKHWSRAIEACNQALSISPDFQLARNNLRFAKESQKVALARISALEAKLQPSNTDGIVQLGLEYYSIGEYDPAISAWEKIPTTAKVWPTSQNNIASAYILKKDFSHAKAALEKALSAEPKNSLFLNNRAWLARAESEAAAVK